MLGSRVRFVTFPSVGMSLVLAWTDEARRGRALNAAMYLGIHEEVPARSLVWIREYCLRSFPVCDASCLPGNGSTGEGRSDTPINVRENVERERESLLPAILVWRELTPRVCGSRRLYFHSQCLLFLLVQSSSPPPCIQSPRDSRQATTPTYAMQAEADAPLLNRKLRHCSVYSMFRRGTTKLPRELSRRGHSVPFMDDGHKPCF